VTGASPATVESRGPLELCHQGLRSLVRLLGMLAGAGLLAMVLITTVDVVLRVFHLSLKGAYDLTCIAAALTISAALPYTTAIKGHVAIEYFFQKLGPRGRIVGDTLMRTTLMALFGLLAWQSIRYGNSLKASGTVSMTVQLPIFWVPYVLAVSCLLVVLIKIYHVFHPGQSLLKP
jgi:TRAP-type C4-dicarboxylate transport system permease small subunit